MFFESMVLALVVFSSDARLLIHPTPDLTRIRLEARLTAGISNRLPQGLVDAAVARKLLKLCLVDENGRLGSPIFGTYRRQGASLLFAPRYGLAHRQLYRAVFTLSANKQITVDHRIPPRAPTEAPAVQRIYPTSTVLPANHLKFYIYFSKPMREGRDLFDRLQLLNETGEPVSDPWRRTELWTADARRLTLWIHPGRVKQGVNLREEEGPVLEPGRHYSLVVGSEITDLAGQRLGKTFVKKFATIAADYTRPLPSGWQIRPPRLSTREALRIEFGEPLDYALAQRLLKIHDSRGRPVDGQSVLGENETSWSFYPTAAWSETAYRVVIDELLEDLAGNTPLRVFDMDLRQPADPNPKLRRTFQPLR